MSAAVGSGKRPNPFSEEAEALYDPYADFALKNACLGIPWPEWIDAELNAESWDEGKAGKAVTAAGYKNASVLSNIGSSCYVDPKPPNLPPPLGDYVKMWKRPQDVFPNEELTVVDPKNIDFELQVPSILSSGCNFLKVFMEQLNILQFYAIKYGFIVEMETANFVANTQGELWRPWHHVYSMCKAGKGHFHKPLYCPYGKYVVRLFYMGMWRRFVVDDRIPCDLRGHCMLPTTQTAGELWPIILTKALFKIVSLTPCKDFFGIDFQFVSALTGWTHYHFSAENKTCDQVWRRFKLLSPHYEQSEKNVDIEKAFPANFGKTSNVKESAKKDSRKSVEKDVTHDRFCVLFATLIRFEENPSVDCSVAVTMTRDSPLVKANKQEGTQPWKKIRWIYWAQEKGLWVDENHLPPYRRLQIINFYQDLSELLVPDPKLEAALYGTPAEDDSAMDEEVFSGESKTFEPEQWCDFFKFTEYLLDVNVFFKPSYFIYNFKVTCLNEKAIEGPAGGKATSKAAPAPQNLFIFPTILKETCNEPVFVLCEALTGIFLCLSLCVSPQENKTCFGYLEVDQPKILKVGRASLIVEMFDWRTVEQGEIIGVVKTVGYCSTALHLKPGRHILKVWVYSDSPYVLNMYSNVNLFVSKSPRIRVMMNSESQQILNYINNISNSFVALTQKFGKPDLPAALRDFYDTIIKPKNDIAVGYRLKLDDLIENFTSCILLTLKDLIPNSEEVVVMMWSLRALFLDPNIQCDLPNAGPPPSIFGTNNAKKAPPKKVLSVPKERTLSEILSSISVCDILNKVVTIQRIFRGFRVRLLRKCQSPGRKEFKPYTERLKKICDTIFIPQKRELEVGKLLRRIVMTKPDLLTTFRFHQDFSNVLQVEEFTGKISNVEPFAWVPIARFVVACHSPELDPCSFNLSCNLEQSVIQGFDNDSGVEIFRVANVVSPHYYHSNVKGYTIFVFGWNEASVKTVNWRLEMVKMKYFQSLHLCNLLLSPMCQPYSMPTLDLIEIKNFFIPNCKSRILRCLIKVQKSTLLTLRLSMSYPNVQFSVIITLDKGFNEVGSTLESDGSENVIIDVTSTNGSVIVPMLLLDYIELPSRGEFSAEREYTEYVLEAFVLNNSWPLTKQEWGLVEPIRVNGESWKDSTTSIQSKKGGSESRKKLQRTSRRSMSEQKVESPFWLLQVLNDAGGPESVESTVVEEDKSYAESVKNMKILWEEKDPGRRARGRSLRMKFLYNMFLEERKFNSCYGEGYGEEGWDEGFSEEPQAIVDRLASFSYLINDVSPTRYTCSPRILPFMPLCTLLKKYTLFEDFWVATQTQTESTQSIGEQSSYNVVLDFIFTLEEERREFLRQCLYYRSIMAEHLIQEQKLSNRLMTQAYDARLRSVERLMA